MKVYSFRIGFINYELNHVANTFHDTLSSDAVLYYLVHVETPNQSIPSQIKKCNVASIVGDVCWGKSKAEYTFAVFKKYSSSATDKIAIQHVLQCLKNKEITL